MTEPVAFDASSRDLVRASLEIARQALGQYVEALRQGHNLLSNSAEVIASVGTELHEIAVRHADEHLQLSIRLAQGLAEAKGLKEMLDVQKTFAQQTAESYARQVQELLQFVTQFTPKADLEAGFE